MIDIQPGAEPLLTTDEATVTPWVEISRRLAEPDTHWLTTVRADGTPHVVPVGGAWVDDAMYFTMGQGTRKGKHLAGDPHCAIAVSRPGFDIVLEGEAERVRDASRLQRVAGVYNETNGWPVTVQGDALDAPYSAPTTGPPPYDVYVLNPKTVFAFGTTEETVNAATRYRF